MLPMSTTATETEQAARLVNHQPGGGTVAELFEALEKQRAKVLRVRHGAFGKAAMACPEEYRAVARRDESPQE